MYYARMTIDGNLIEFHNDVWGTERILVNRQEVSKKYSVFGTEHFFTIPGSDGIDRFVLKTSVSSGMMVMIDVMKNGVPVVVSQIATTSSGTENKYKALGLKYLKQYKLSEAKEELEKAADVDAFDAEIPLYLACIYSLREDAPNGFRCIRKAVERKLSDQSVIESMDKLAYLRIHPAFEDFKASGYKEVIFDEEE